MTSSRELLSAVGGDAVPVVASMSAEGGVALTPEDYFLVSRIDGQTPLRALRSMVGLSEDAFALALTKVVAAGMVRVPGMTRAAAEAAQDSVGFSPMEDAPTRNTPTRPPAEKERPQPWARSDSAQRSMGRYASGMHDAVSERSEPRTTSKAPALGRDLVPNTWPIRFDAFMFDPLAMATGEALDDVQKQVVLYYHYHLRRVTYYDLLNLPAGATRREIKLAYFRLSKAFHPDRWYRKDTGDFGTMIEDVFKWLNRAYGVLSSPKKRKGYDKLIARGYVGEWEFERGGGPAARAPAPPKPQASFSESDPEVRRTATLLEAKARRAESNEDWEQACDLYGRVLQVAPSADLRIRLVECMLAANMRAHEIEQQIAEAKAAGASEAPLLMAEASFAQRAGERQRARRCYERVLEIEPDNAEAQSRLSEIKLSVEPAG